MSELIENLQAFSDQQPFDVGWYFKNLLSSEEFECHGDRQFSAASTRKVPILMAALSAVTRQQVRLDLPIKLSRQLQKNNSGCFRFLTPGIEITFQDALHMMIIMSDNTCTGAVVDLLGCDFINDYSRTIGLNNTELKAGFPPLGEEDSPEHMDVMSPRDAGLILDLILAGSSRPDAAQRLGCSTQMCGLGLQILQRQMLRTKLPQLLPAEAGVAHKTGTRLGVHNDIGINFTNGRPLFILAVYTQNSNPDAFEKILGCRFIATLSRMCYDSLAT